MKYVFTIITLVSIVILAIITKPKYYPTFEESNYHPFLGQIFNDDVNAAYYYIPTTTNTIKIRSSWLIYLIPTLFGITVLKMKFRRLSD